MTKLRGIDVACPTCGSGPGVGCNEGRWSRNHTERTTAAREAQARWEDSGDAAKGWTPLGYMTEGGVASVAPEGTPPQVGNARWPILRTHILEGDKRQPVAGFANYPAAVDLPDPWTPVGPNTLGERVWPCTVERNVRGGVRVGFCFTTPWVGDRMDPTEQEKLAKLQPMLRELRRELMQGEVR